MVIWHVFDDLCDEMKMYNIDKKTPFRYRRGSKIKELKTLLIKYMKMMKTRISLVYWDVADSPLVQTNETISQGQ